MTHASTWINPAEAKAAIERGTGRGIKIAVIDSGIELSHPALRHLRLIDDIAFEENEQGLARRVAGGGVDAYGHGTAIASVILRAAPEVELGSFRVLDSKLGCKRAIVQEAALLAIERGYHIISCSFGCAATLETIGYFKSWIDYAYTQGVHVVSACNNNYFRDAEWPGFFPSVITVNMARTLEDDIFLRWDVSEKGTVRHLVEFAARGVELQLPWKNHQTAQHSGSSYAAPHVAGRLARLLSIYPQIKPLVAKCLLQEVAEAWTVDIRGLNS
jgi:subtilisin family serine protease